MINHYLNMKKLLLSALLIFAAVLSARAQFTYGISFGLYSNNASTTNSGTGTTETGGASFNYSLSPTLGYYFKPGVVAGLKFNYTNCSYTSGDGFFSAASVNSMLMNLLMGNGLESDYQSWKLSPYVRVRTFSLLDDRLGVWVEVDGYYGTHTPRTDGELNPDKAKTIFGVEIHPLVSFDVTDKYMLYTSLDYPSFSWDGSINRSAKKDGTVDAKRTNAFLFQAKPLIAAANAVLNVGIMRKF